MKKLLFILVAFFWGSFLIGQESNSKHEKWEYILVDTGDVLQIALPLSGLAFTILEKDYEGTKQFAYSFGTTMAVTYILKSVTKRKRPENRNSYDSFPSGHTSAAFSGASFIQRRYGWRYGWPAYVLASIVGVSRLEGPDGYHHFIDVLGGAVIAVASTYLFTKPYTKNKLQVSFSSNALYSHVTFNYSF
ncbi:phosphatase PAP2 family protein [Flavobacteriaceae bacterium KMM 6898]|nr:phosphatase PAP2 family protein [Flavobacteriaceae bacterium KMM 6898]